MSGFFGSMALGWLADWAVGPESWLAFAITLCTLLVSLLCLVGFPLSMLTTRRLKRWRPPARDPELRAPTPGSLLYLFGDRVARTEEWPAFLQIGMSVPCSKTRVKPKELPSLILACTFWSLREQGYVTFDYEPPVNPRRKPTLSVTTTRPGRCGGLERSLLLATEPPPESKVPWFLESNTHADQRVSSVVWRWYMIALGGARAGKMSDGRAVRAAQLELETLGFVDPPRMRSLFDFDPLGHVEWDCSAVAALEPDFDRLHEQWRAFTSAEPGVYRDLVKGCRAGLGSRENASGPG